MANWEDVGQLAKVLGGERLSGTMCRIELPGCEPARRQQVYLSYELMAPDFEFVRVMSAFAMIDLVDLGAVVRRVGPLQIGCLSYQHVFENGKPVDGFVTLASTTPLATLDLPAGDAPFGLYLHIFARAADSLEREFAGQGQQDFF